MDELEWIERRALQSWHEAADAPAREAAGLSWTPIAGGFASMGTRLPASAIVVNRALSLGMERPARREEIAGLVAHYREKGVARFFAQVHPEAEPPELADWLAEAGLQKARGWMKFARGRAAPPEVRTGLTIGRIGPEHAAAMAEIAANAFDLGEAARPWIACVVRSERWRAFGAFEGDRLAAIGGLYVEDGVGWCDFGATAPAFRRRGAQSALLAARIRAALDLGCRLIGTCTGEAVPGDPQHSYSNILKMGFRERYVRLNFAPPRA